MASNDIITQVIKEYFADCRLLYTEYDNENGTSLWDGVSDLLKETLNLYKVRSVTTDLVQQFKNPIITDTKTVTDEGGNETEESYERTSNTYALCYAIDRQLAEVECVLVSIMLLTNLDYAIGEQLDKIGDILNLTRAEAALLCGGTEYFDVLDDEPYRRYLKYKAIINSNDCTYYTLMKAYKSIIGESATIEYLEDEDYPATIFIELTADEDNSIYLQAIPPIKPAGVAVKYLTTLVTEIDVALQPEFYKSNPNLCGTFYCGTYPIVIEEVIGSSTKSE